MRTDLVRVWVRLYWWGGDSRRLVLVRTIDYSTHVREMWRSRPVDEEKVAVARLVFNRVQWHQLWSGWPVGKFDLSIPLHWVSDEDDADDRAAMSEAVSGPDFHLLYSGCTIAHNDPRESVREARPEVATRQPPRPFRSHPDRPSHIFALTTTEAPSAGTTPYEIDLSDVRGVMIGDGNQQINRFEITVQDARFDLDRVFARAEVQKAAAEVIMNPGDESHRARLINVLAHPGWFVSWRPARLRVDDPGAKRSAGFLNTLLGFNVDVKVGDNLQQTNRFTYVTSRLPEAQDLLASNEKLARAVAGLICPAHATMDVASMLKVVNEAVQGLPVDFVNGRLQALKLAPSPRMSLVRVDGAMVGDDPVQENFIEVMFNRTTTDVDRVRRKHEWLSGPSRPKGPDRGGEHRGPSGPSLV